MMHSAWARRCGQLALCGLVACAGDLAAEEDALQVDGELSAALESDEDELEVSGEIGEAVSDTLAIDEEGDGEFTEQDQADFDGNLDELPEAEEGSFAAGSVTVAAAGQGNVRVMTWNVKTEKNGAGAWARVVGNQKPDILALQEICVREVKQLKEQLKKNYGLSYDASYGSVRNQGGDWCAGGSGAFGNAMLTLSKLRKSGTKNVLYAVQRKGGEKRGYHTLSVTFPNGATVRVFNTHIDHKEAAQQGQVAELAAAARAHPKALVLGDFNLKPKIRIKRERGGYEVITNPRLRPMENSFEEADPAHKRPTFPNDPNDRAKPPESKIDYIYFRGLDRRTAVETYWTASSDHRPKIAEFR